MILSSSRKRRERDAAERLYAAVVAASRRPALFLAYGVEDTLQGRFEMLALHLFPLLHRLMHDPGDDPDLARLVSEAMVVAMDDALRELGVSDTRVPRRMKTLYRSFAGRISAYSQALAGGDAALAAAVARNVYPDHAEHTRALALGRYLGAAVLALRAADPEALRRGVLPYPEPVTSEEQMA